MAGKVSHVRTRFGCDVCLGRGIQSRQESCEQFWRSENHHWRAFPFNIYFLRQCSELYETETRKVFLHLLYENKHNHQPLLYTGHLQISSEALSSDITGVSFSQDEYVHITSP